MYEKEWLMNIYDTLNDEQKKGVFFWSSGLELIDMSEIGCTVPASVACNDTVGVVAADWKEYIRGASGKEKFGLVFLDPPYAEGILDDVLHRLQYSELLAPGAIVVAESDQNGIPNPVDGWSSKLYRYGKTYVTIIRVPEEA